MLPVRTARWCWVCPHQAHHHVHRADFDRVDSVDKLLDLVKGGPVGGAVSAAAADELWLGLDGVRTFQTQTQALHGNVSHEDDRTGSGPTPS